MDIENEQVKEQPGSVPHVHCQQREEGWGRYGQFLNERIENGKHIHKRRRGRQRMRWLDSVIKATNMNLTQLWEAAEDRRAWHALVCGVTKSQTRLNN